MEPHAAKNDALQNSIKADEAASKKPDAFVKMVIVAKMKDV